MYASTKDYILSEMLRDERIAEEKEYREHQEKIKEWKNKWPFYCRSCDGWGEFNYSQRHPYGIGYATEFYCEPCEALPIEKCHRCFEDGLNPEDGSGPCKYCGWNYGKNCSNDDGVPQYY